jgi:hypothetical protein
MADDDAPPPSGVIVAVRLRPLFRHLGREAEGAPGAFNCVQMENGKTTIIDSEGKDQGADKREFKFDYS